MRKLFSTLTAFVIAGFIVDSASAATRTWDAGGGADKNWSTAANWSNDTVPTSSDVAVFPALSGVYTAIMDSCDCLYLVIHSNCTLDFNASSTLHIWDNGSNPSTIAGTIILRDASVIRLHGDHTFAPMDISSVLTYGTVSGRFNSAQLQIDDGKTFVNQINIVGALQMLEQSGSGSASFRNDDTGVVNANYNGSGSAVDEVLNIGPRLVLLADAGAFQVSSNSAAVLRFTNGYATSPPSMTSPITVSAGTLDFVQSFYTQGALSFTGGTIQVATTKAAAFKQPAP